MYNVIFFTDVTDNIDSTLSLGAYKLATTLRLQGYSCLVVNNLSEFSTSELKKLIDLTVNDNTVMVGFSTTFMLSTVEKDPTMPTPSLPPLAIDTVFPQGKEFEGEILSYIKSKNNKCKILAGGAKVHPQYSNKNIDYVCLGYGELSVVNLVNHLTWQQPLRKSFRNLHGCIIIDDKLASGYDFANDIMLREKIDVVNYKVLPIEIGRGCIFKCKFCAYPMNGKKTLDFVKNTEVLYQELKHNYDQFGISTYHIVDDTFNDYKDKLLAIRDVVQRLDFQPIFWAYIRLDLICTHPETLDILYDIGLRFMYFGIESLNERTGRIIGKGFNRQKQIDMMNRIKDQYSDVSMHTSFILGLPEETESSFTQTFDQLMSGYIPADSWVFYPLYILPKNVATFNSEITENYEKFGYQDLGGGQGYINWANEYTNFTSALKMSNEFMESSRKLDRFKITGSFAMNLKNYGQDYTLTKNISWKNFDWHHIEHNIKPNFVYNYKRQLFDLIQST